MKLYKRFIAALLCVVMMVTSTPLGFLGDLKLFDGFDFTAAAEEQTSETAKYLNSYYNGDPYAAKIGLKAYLVDKDDGSLWEIEDISDCRFHPSDLIRIEIWVQTNYFHSTGQIALAYPNEVFEPTYQDFSTYDYYSLLARRKNVFALQEAENAFSGEGTLDSPIYLSECVSVTDMCIGTRGDYEAIKNAMPPSWRGEDTTYSDPKYAEYNYLQFGYENDYDAENGDKTIVVNEYQPIANFYLTISEDACPGDTGVITIPAEGISTAEDDTAPTFLTRFVANDDDISYLKSDGTQYLYTDDYYYDPESEPDHAPNEVKSGIVYDLSEASIEFRITEDYVEPALADYTALNQAKEEFESLNREDYTADSWNAAEQAYAEACSLPDDLIADVQNVIDEATEALIAAISSLILLNEEVDKTELLAVIQSVHALNEDEYTADSWSELVAALEHAEMINGEEDVLQEEVDAAVAELKFAINSLAKKVDKTELLAVIQSVHALNEDEYTADSWSELVAALEHAEMINGEEAVLQEEVNAAVAELKSAINSLVKKVDKTALEEAIAMAEATENIGYTDDSWADFQAALASAKSVYEDDDAVQEDIDYAEANLLAAISMLKEAESESPENPSDAIASGTCGESLVWYITTDGELIISGEGAMPGYDGVYDSLRNENGNMLPWYSYRSQIKKITIEKGVTSVGRAAFVGMDYDVTVSVPETVSSIGDYAFTEISSISVNSNNEYFSNDEYGVLYNKDKTTLLQYPNGNARETYTVPESVTALADNAFETFADDDLFFSDFRGVRTVTIPSSVKNIGSTWPDSCTLGGCIKEVHYKGTVEEWVSVFGKFLNWTRMYFNNDTEGTCGSDLIWRLSGSTLTVSGTGGTFECYTEYDEIFGGLRSPFSGESYSEVIIESGVTSIGNEAFAYCDIGSIIIPSTVTTIARDAFNSGIGMGSVSDIYYCGTEEKWKSIFKGIAFKEYYYDDDYNMEIVEATIHYNYNYVDSPEIPDDVIASGTCGVNLVWYLTKEYELVIDGSGEMNNYESEHNTPWAEYEEKIIKLTIGDRVTRIGDYAFSYLYGIERVMIPDSVEHIGREAFSNCIALENVSIGSKVNSIDERAFMSCGLKSIDVDADNNYYSNDSYGVLFDKSKTELIQYVDGNNVSHYDIPQGVTAIAPYAFYKSHNLKSVTFPDSLKTIGEYAFMINYKLINVVIPDSVTHIGEGAFNFCDGMESVIIGNGVKVIGNYAFDNCWNLTKITLGNSVENIGEYAFNFCERLYSIIIPNSVKTIGDFAFSNTWINNITIGNGITEISEYAFDECGSLTDIYFAGSESQWNTAFTGALSDAVTVHFGIEINCDYTELEAAIANAHSLNESEYTPASWSVLEEALAAAELLVAEQRDSQVDIDTAKLVLNNAIDALVKKADKSALANAIADTQAIDEQLYTPDSWIEADLATEINNALVVYNDDNATVDEVRQTIMGLVAAVAKLVEKADKTALEKAISLAQTYDGSNYTESSWAEVEQALEYAQLVYNDDNASQSEVNSAEANLLAALADLLIASGTCGENLIWYLTDEYELVISGTGDMEDYSSDGAPWYSYSSDIKKVTLESGITSIGNYAFYFCNNDNLEIVNIPDTVTSIGDYAFFHCEKLTTVVIPGSVKTIGMSAFQFCYHLKELTISDGVETIGNWAFRSSAISKLTIPGSVSVIGKAAFDFCVGLEYVNIKEGVPAIGEHAFYNCESLKSISIPASVTAIDNTAFENCSSLSEIFFAGSEEQWYSAFPGVLPDDTTVYWRLLVPDNAIGYGDINGNLTWYVTGDYELVIGGVGPMLDDMLVDDLWCDYYHDIRKITICNGVTNIAARIFQGMDSLESVTISDTVTQIGAKAFCKCDKLTSVKLSESLIYIDDQAFYGCSSLKTIAIPEHIQLLGMRAFEWCTSIESFYVDPENEYYSSDSYGVIFDKEKTVIYQYPCGNTRTRYDIPYGVWCINWGAFEGNESLVKITIPDTVTGITECAFNGCSALKSLEIPDSVRIIDDYAINNCDNLESITIGSGIEFMGYLFEGCTSLKNVTIKNEQGIKDIYDEEVWSTFRNCDTLENLTLADTVHFIAEEAFYDCDNLKRVEFGKSVNTIFADAFLGCDNLTDVYFRGSESDWRKITIDTGNEALLSATIHYNWTSHIHNYTWVVETAPTTIQSGTKKKVCTICGETVGEAVEIPSTGFVATNGMVVDYGNSIVFGLDAGVDSLDGYTSVVAEGCEWEYTEGENGFGTGTKAVLKNGAEIVEEYTVVIFGDIQGDGWYDGEDAFIANLIAKGVLDKDDVGEVIWTAADCNHDGVIDEADVDLLSGAGLMLNDVDQKRTQAELATDSAYIEYAMLIDQSAGMNTGFVTTPDADENVESEDDTTTEIETDTEESDDSAEKTDVEIIFANIFGFVKKIFNLIFSFIIK